MLIVGDGPFLAEAKELFLRAGVIEKTLFEGKQPFDAALAYYREIDLALYPRDSTRVTETVESLKPAEAVSAGVPVVVSNVRPLASLIANCPAVLAVNASDSGDLARAVESFFSKSEAERRAIGTAGREWVAANRSWKHTVKAIQAAYDSVL
jgi:glycosyltransferase involved in cell wall biosynthesis